MDSNPVPLLTLNWDCPVDKIDHFIIHSYVPDIDVHSNVVSHCCSLTQVIDPYLWGGNKLPNEGTFSVEFRVQAVLKNGFLTAFETSPSVSFEILLTEAKE